MDKILFSYHSKNKNISIIHSKSDKTDKNLFPIHMHDYYELYYFISGDITYYIEGQIYKLESNDLLVINNKELHRPCFNSETAYERVVISFLPEYVSSLNSEEYNLLYFFENRKLGNHNKINASDVLSCGYDDYLNQIKYYARENRIESSAMIFTIFAQMLISLNKFFSDKMMDLSITKIDRDNKIPHILDYINKNLSKKLSLDLLSSIFYINKYHLCHLFKKNTGFTVQEYVIYKRIMKAKELLSQGISAVETCDAVGFGDYSNFYRYFKKVVGKTPKEFFMQ